MKKWRNSLLLILMAGLSVAQTGDMVQPEVRRIGDRLACLCGSCKNTVATCQMLGCHYTSPARARISAMSKAGVSDEAIIDDFVKREGKKALAAPTAEGFGLEAGDRVGSGLLAGVSAADQPGSAAFDAKLEELHWRFYARRADAAWLAEIGALWSSVAAREGPRAWGAVVSAMVQDPLFVSY